MLLKNQPVKDINIAADVPLFDDTLALQEASFSSLLLPGLPIDISLDWLALKEPEVDYVIWLEMSEPGSDEPFLSQSFKMWPDTYPPSHWRMGDRVTTFHRLQIPLDIPTDSDPLLKVRLTFPDGLNSLPLTQGNNALATMSLVLRNHNYETPYISQPL